MGGHLMTCTGCGQKVIYDEATKLHHCGKCIRVGERVEWIYDGEEGERLTGTVTAYDLGRFLVDQVLVLWDHLPPDAEAYVEARENLRHINVLDQIVEALDAD